MSESELNEVMRTLGRIESSVDEMRRRMDATDMTMASFSKSIGDLRLDRARFRGGYVALATIAGAAATVGGLIVGFFRH
jgi:hypothetical protein